jgi:hypothetical protein
VTSNEDVQGTPLADMRLTTSSAWDRTESASPGCCRPAHRTPTTTPTPPKTAACSTGVRATTTSPTSPCSPPLTGPRR